MKCHETSVSSCVPISSHAFSCQLHGYVPTKNGFQCFPCFPIYWGCIIASFCCFMLGSYWFILVSYCANIYSVFLLVHIVSYCVHMNPLMFKARVREGLLSYETNMNHDES